MNHRAPTEPEPSSQQKPSSPQAPSRAPTWTDRPAPDRWVNWTALSRTGDVLLAGTYHAEKTGNYGTYCYNRAGDLLWHDPFPQQGFCGVFWVDLSASGAYGASGGWQSEHRVTHRRRPPFRLDVPTQNDVQQNDVQYTGFVRAYSTAPYELLLAYRTEARVNSVRLSQQGAWLAAGSGDAGGRDDAVYLFERTAAGYHLADRFGLPTGDASVGTVALSDDGRWLVAGGGRTVLLLENDSGTLREAARWRVPGRYVQFTQITPDGDYFAASGSDGRFFFFDRTHFCAHARPAWTYDTGTEKNVYGVTVSPHGTHVAASSNANGGTIFVVENVADDSAPAGWPARLAWKARTQRPPSPSVTMDRRARFLTVADGYPLGTPGHYYLFEIATGRCLWQHTTDNMNWPMVISDDGSAVFAGSDDGQVSFFDLRTLNPSATDE